MLAFFHHLFNVNYSILKRLAEMFDLKILFYFNLLCSEKKNFHRVHFCLIFLRGDSGWIFAGVGVCVC